MNNLVKKITIVMLIGVVFSLTGLAQAAEKIYVPMLTYTTGPYAPGGLPIDQGFRDYFKYVNATGGVNGVMLDWETCEYGYNTGRGVECYDRIKSKNGKMGVAVFPLLTGVLGRKAYAPPVVREKTATPISSFLLSIMSLHSTTRSVL